METPWRKFKCTLARGRYQSVVIEYAPDRKTFEADVLRLVGADFPGQKLTIIGVEELPYG